MTGNPIIVALDVPTGTDAIRLVEQLRDQISIFKIGLQLYTGWGPQIVRQVLATGAKVFLDLKFHDIPNTVGRAVEAANLLNAHMLTIHLSGGSQMIAAAVAARKSTMVLGVTVLTSANAATLDEIGVTEQIDRQVLRLARLGVEAGIDGVVASPLEIAALRSEFGDRIKIITPGVRPSWSETGDQQRVMTPREAIKAGADYLVIGRPITAHPNPAEAVHQIVAEIAQ